jgi:hypothetical protein
LVHSATDDLRNAKSSLRGQFLQGRYLLLRQVYVLSLHVLIVHTHQLGGKERVMPQTRTLILRPPLAGVLRRYGLQSQSPYSSCSALNVHPTDPLTGRDRIGTRPGLTSSGLTAGTPYNSCEATFLNGGTLYRGAAVTHSGGTRIFVYSAGAPALFGGGDFITTDPGSDFSSCCVINQTLIQASAATTTTDVRYNALSGAAGAGTALASHPDVDGTPPKGCGIAVAHLGSLWLMGDVGNPHAWYRSRVGTFADFNYTDTDAAAAVSGTGVNGGIIGEPITAGLSSSDQCLLIGCTDSLYIIRGNVARNGETAVLSHEVGPLMQAAWCHDAKGNVWMMTRDGLYHMPYGCGSAVESVSRESIPAELLAVNPAGGDYCSVAYDHRFRGLHIYVDSAGTDQFWFYDLQSGGFWPMSFTDGPLRLGVRLKSVSDEDDSGLLPINSTGTVFRFDRDSTESFASSLWFGPIALGGPGAEGIIHSVQATLAANSGNVGWRIFTGNSAEQALAQSPAAFTGSAWTIQGLNHTQHPRRRGAFAFLEVYASGTTRWALEEIACVLHSAGVRRVH